MSAPNFADIKSAVVEPAPETRDYVMQQTMLRIRDPKASLDFYTRVLGMRLLCELHFDQWKFSLYFVGYANKEDIPEDEKERVQWTFRQPGTVELTHNWGTENDADFAGYHNGNSDPRGFGHIGVAVPDVEAACARFEQLNVDFQKRLSDGSMHHIAFIKDPDQYWIEIFQATRMA
ncbi:MAG: hypothetical protein MHM6MM_003774 [Cercozoa sp. M6MM]